MGAVECEFCCQEISPDKVPRPTPSTGNSGIPGTRMMSSQCRGFCVK